MNCNKFLNNCSPCWMSECFKLRPHWKQLTHHVSPEAYSSSLVDSPGNLLMYLLWGYIPVSSIQHAYLDFDCLPWRWQKCISGPAHIPGFTEYNTKHLKWLTLVNSNNHASNIIRLPGINNLSTMLKACGVYDIQRMKLLNYYYYCYSHYTYH